MIRPYAGGGAARTSIRGDLGRSAGRKRRFEWYLRQGGTIGSGIRPPFALVSWDPGYESRVEGEVVKLESKVFDEFLEAYVDAHDEGERVEEPTDAVCRVAAIWPVDSARGGLYALCIALGLGNPGLAE